MESSASREGSRVAFAIVALTLGLAYALTLAPGVTFWDAGEFQAAIGTLGVPHPPGTPLYVLIGHVWARAFEFLPQAVAVNLLSAVATAIACGLVAILTTRSIRTPVGGVAAGLSSGTMLTVWRNATETEVYALSLLLAMMMVVTGEAAGRRDSVRLRFFLAYLIALAVPLHISALIAAPAAIMLATTNPQRIVPDGRWLAALGGGLATVIGFSLGAAWAGLIGIAALLWSATGPLGRRDRWRPVVILAAVIGGLSVTAFMLIRAPHDPFVNEGNPSTFARMLSVVWRDQYPLSSLWHRHAPPGIQVFNFVQYADWQVAFGLDPSPTASWLRTPISLTVLMLAVIGARSQWRTDRRTAIAIALLFASASIGVVTILNMPPGASTPDSLLAAGARRQPRDVDYFFALAFAALGPWIAAGAFAIARWSFSANRTRSVSLATIGIAGLPLALNWPAADRRTPGDADLASMVGKALLSSAPPNAVLLLTGDNDTFPVWYRHAVLGERPDVIPVAAPLLAAPWYRAEQARRHRLLNADDVDRWISYDAAFQALAASARAQGRSVAVPLSMAAKERALLARAWTLRGLLLVARSDTSAMGDAVNREETARIIRLFPTTLSANHRSPPDPAADWALRFIKCPGRVLAQAEGTTGPSLDESIASLCNFR